MVRLALGLLAVPLLWGQNAALDRLADASTRYAIGSVSKQFTSSALLLFQERGKISLDDKVSYEDYAPHDYMPGRVLLRRAKAWISGARSR
jgi:CubicO group peptidase (beta-lactamase class C family)